MIGSSASVRADDHYNIVHSFNVVGANNYAPGGYGPGPVTGHETGGDPSTWALYGTTQFGGSDANGNSTDGLAYKLTAPAAGLTQWTLTRLFNFPSSSLAQNPFGPVVFDGAGAIYGLAYPTKAGGGPQPSTLYQLKPPASGYFWNLNTHVLDSGSGTASFAGNPDLAVGRAGYLFGTKSPFLAHAVVGGQIYQIKTPTPGNGWEETILFNIPGGTRPTGVPLVVGPSGEIYGTTSSPNPLDPGPFLGSVYRLAPAATPGGAWTYTRLVTFVGPATSSNVYPNALFLDPSGTLYGAMSGHGPSFGSVFSLTPPSAGQTKWTAATLYTFKGIDGANPNGLVRFGAGPLYGTTSAHVSSAAAPGGGGLVFALDPPTIPGGAWTERTVAVTQGGPNHSAGSLNGPLVRDPGGQLYTSPPLHG